MGIFTEGVVSVDTELAEATVNFGKETNIIGSVENCSYQTYQRLRDWHMFSATQESNRTSNPADKTQQGAQYRTQRNAKRRGAM